MTHSPIGGTPPANALDQFLRNSYDVVQKVHHNLPAIRAVAEHLTPVEDLLEFRNEVEELHAKLGLLVAASQIIVRASDAGIDLLIAEDAAAQRVLLGLKSAALYDKEYFASKAEFDVLTAQVVALSDVVDGILVTLANKVDREELQEFQDLVEGMIQVLEDRLGDIDAGNGILGGRLTYIEQALQDGTYWEVLQQRTALLEAILDNPLTGNSALATALEQLTIRITESEEGISVVASDLTELVSRVANAETGLEGETTARNLLESRTSILEGTVSAQASDISTLRVSTANANTLLEAQGTAIGGLTTRIDQNDAAVLVVSSDVSQLDSRVTDAETGIISAATAVDELTTRVDQTEDELTIAAEDRTHLKASLTSTGNHLPNAGFAVDLRGWTLFARGPGWLSAQLERNLQPSEGALPAGINALSLFRDGVPSGDAGVRTTRIPVEDLASYLLSGYLAAENCTVRLEWRVLDAAGDEIGYGLAGSSSNPPSNRLSDWDRVHGLLSIPADGVSVEVQWWVVDCHTDSPRAWLVRPMLEPQHGFQEAPSPWMEGVHGLEESFAEATQLLETRLTQTEDSIEAVAQALTELDVQVGTGQDWRIVNHAGSAAYDEVGSPLPPGLYRPGEETAEHVFGRGLTLLRFGENGNLASAERYDTYASNTERQRLADDLDALTAHEAFVLVSQDHHGIKLAALTEQLEHSGALNFTNVTGSRPYILAGRPGLGRGGGIEVTAPVDQPWNDFLITVVNDTPQGLGTQSGVTDLLVGQAGALEDLQVLVERNGDDVTAISSDLVDLTARVDTSETGLSAQGEALSELTTEVERIDGDVSVLTGSLTELGNELRDPETGLATRASSIELSQVATDLDTVTGTVTSHGQQLGQLSTRLDDAETEQTSQSDALQTLETTVSNQGGELTALTTSVTGLTSQVTDLETGQSNTASALQTLNTEVEGLTGKVESSYSLRLDANDYWVGWEFLNDGSTGSVKFRADNFTIAAPDGFKSVQFQDGVLFSQSPTHSYYHGAGFGEVNQFITWYGPTPSEGFEGATRDEGIFYITTDGAPYFGGALSNDQVGMLPVVVGLQGDLAALMAEDARIAQEAAAALVAEAEAIRDELAATSDTLRTEAETRAGELEDQIQQTQTDLNSEIDTRTGALQQALDDEIDRALDAEFALGLRADGLLDDIAAEGQARTAAIAAEAQDRAAAIADEAQARADAIAAEAALRSAGDTAEASARASAIADETAARVAALQDLSDNLWGTIDALGAQMADIMEADEHDPALAYPDPGDLVQSDGKLYRSLQPVPTGIAITDEAYWQYIGEYDSLGEAVAATVARVNVLTSSVTTLDGEIEAINTLVTDLQSGLGDAEGNITANTGLISALGTRVTETEGLLEAVAEDITGLTTVIEGKADASALTALTTRVTETEGSLDSVVQDITDLEATIPGLATVAALDTLTTRVTENEDGIEAVTTDLTALTTVVDGKASAGAVSDLTTRVTETEDAIESVATDLTALETVVDGKASAGAVSALETRVTETESGIDALSTDITNLETVLEGKASSAALSALTTRVTEAEGEISSMASDIVDLGTELDGKASTGALSALDVRVTENADGIEAVASDITALNTALDGKASTGALQALDTRVTENADGIEAVATDVTNLTTVVDGKASTGAVSLLETRVEANEGGISSLGSDLTTLSSTVDGKADSSALTALTTRVTDNEDGIDTINQSIVDLTAEVDGKASGSAVSSLSNRVTATEDEIVSLGESLIALGSEVDGKASQGAVSSLETRVTDTEDLLEAQGTSLTELEGVVAGKASSSGLIALTTRVTTAEGSITSLTQDLSNLSSTVDGKADGSALSALTTRVTDTEDELESLSQDLTALGSTVANKADAAAVQALTTRVTDAEGELTSLSGSLTDLSGRLTDAEGDITAQGDAVSALTVRVTENEEGIESVASQTDALRVSLGDMKIDTGVPTFRQPDEPQITGVRRNLFEGSEGDLSTYGAKGNALEVSPWGDFEVGIRGDDDEAGFYVYKRERPLGFEDGEYVFSAFIEMDSGEPPQPTRSTATSSGNIRILIGGSVVESADTRVEHVRENLYRVIARRSMLSGSSGWNGITSSNGQVLAYGNFTVSGFQLEKGSEPTPYQVVRSDIDFDGSGLPVGSIWHKTDENDEVIQTLRYSGEMWDDVSDSSKASVQSVTDVIVRVTETEDGIEALGQDLQQISATLDDKADAGAVQLLSTRVTEVEDGLESTSSSITSLETQIGGLGGDIDALENSVSGNASAISGLTTDVTNLGGDITSMSSSVTALENAIVDPSTGLGSKASASAVSALQTEVDELDGDVASLSSSVTSLSNTINHPSTGLDSRASSSAVSALDSRVSAVEASASDVTSLESRLGTVEGSLIQEMITSAQNDAVHTSAINLMESRLDDPDSGLEANATGLSGLTTRVSSVEGTTSSHTTQLTNLQAQVNALDVDAGGSGQAIADLTVRVEDVEGEITSHGDSITALQNSVTSANKVYVQDAQPSTSGQTHGNLWIDSNDNNKLYAFNSSTNKWELRQDAGKNTIFVQGTQPTARAVNDLWFDTSRNNRQFRWNGSAWVEVTDTRTTANATAVSSLTTRVSNAEGVNTTQGNQITTLTNQINHSSTGLQANATAISGLTSRVTSAEGTISSHTSDITSLENKVNHSTSGNSALASNLSSLTSRVSGAEGTLSSHTSSINSLNSKVNHSTTGLAATASNVSALTTRVSSAEGTLTSHTSSISTMNTTVGNHSSTITNHTSSINGLRARHTLTMNVNGHISGTRSENNGNSSSFSILATVFRVISGGNAGLEWQNGYLRAYAAGAQVIIGVNFGTTSNLMMWAGPNIGANSASKANGTFWLDNTGDGYFAGRVLQGVLRWFNSTTSTSATASVTTGNNPRLGKTVSLAVRYQFNESWTYLGGTVSPGSGATAANIQIQRRYGSGSWSTLLTRYVQGSAEAYNGQIGSGDPSSWNIHIGAEILATDTASTNNSEYRARITSRSTRGHNPGTSGQPVVRNQYLSIEAME